MLKVACGLQALHKHEVHQAAMFSPNAKIARRQSAANAQLPHAFDALRASFGPSGPCVRPYDVVSSSTPALYTPNFLPSFCAFDCKLQQCCLMTCQHCHDLNTLLVHFHLICMLAWMRLSFCLLHGHQNHFDTAKGLVEQLKLKNITATACESHNTRV